MKIIRSLLIFASASIVLNACSKKETPGPSVTYKSPTTAHANITIPAGLQAQAGKDSVNAMIAVSYMGIANGLGSYSSFFNLPGGQATTATANGAVYSWSYSGVSEWMTYSVLSDKYTWTYEWKTPELARFTYISAQEAKNGSSGSWEIYDPSNASHTVVWDYSWTLTGTVYSATMNFYNSGSATTKFVVLDNGNNSGSFQYFEGTMKKADIEWNSNGTGTYWFSDDGTNPTATGSWTAAGK